MRSIFLKVALLTCLMQVSLFVATAEESEETKAPTPAVVNVVQIEKLIPELAAQKEFLEETSDSLAKITVTEFVDRIAQLQIKVTARLEEVSALRAATNARLSFEQLEREDELLLKSSEAISAVNENVSDTVSQLTAIIEAIDRRSERWTNTEKRLEGQDVPGLAIAKIKVALSELKQSKDTVETTLEAALIAQADASALATDVRKAQLWIESARSKLRSILLVRDGPPLYSKAFWLDVARVSGADINAAFHSHGSYLREYFADHTSELLTHLFLLFVIGWFVFQTRKSDFVKQSFPKLCDNPILLTFTATLLLSLLLYQDADRRFNSFLGITLVVPLILFFRELLDYKFNVTVAGIGLIYLGDQLRTLLGDFEALSAVILLIEFLGACVLSLRFARRTRSYLADDTVTQKRLVAFLGFVARIGSTAFFMLAIFASLGFYRLTAYLGDSIFYALYSALLFFAIFRLVDGFSYSLLYTRILSRLRSVVRYRNQIRARIEQIVSIGLVFVWAIGVLNRSGLYETAMHNVSALFGAGVSFGDFEMSIGAVLLALFIVVLGFHLAKLAVVLIDEEVYGRKTVDPGIRATVDTAIKYTIVTIAVLSAVSSLGVGFQNIAIIAGALSVGIGFGLQNIVNNFVSGLILLVERPIKVGDLILLGETLGNVTRIGIRSSTVRTLDEAEIIIPNGTLVTESVTNWTLSNRRARLSARIGVAYASDVPTVMQILSDVAKAQDYTLDYPEVSVLFKEFGDSSLNFEVRVWIANAQEIPSLQSRLMVAISKGLKENNIEIPFPQRDLHLRSADATINISS